MLEIVLTREDANTEFALLSEWLVANRAEVAAGTAGLRRRDDEGDRRGRSAGRRHDRPALRGRRRGRARQDGRLRRRERRRARLAGLGRRAREACTEAGERRIARRRGRPPSSQSGTESTSRRSRSGASSPRRTSRSSSRARRPPRRNADRRSPVSRPRTSRSPRRSSSTRRPGRSTSDFLDCASLRPRLLPAPLARREDLDPEGARSADRRGRRPRRGHARRRAAGRDRGRRGDRPARDDSLRGDRRHRRLEPVRRRPRARLPARVPRRGDLGGEVDPVRWRRPPRSVGGAHGRGPRVRRRRGLRQRLPPGADRARGVPDDAVADRHAQHRALRARGLREPLCARRPRRPGASRPRRGDLRRLSNRRRGDRRVELLRHVATSRRARSRSAYPRASREARATRSRVRGRPSWVAA